MNIKRVCLWSHLFNCDEIIEKKLVVLSFHEKNHKRNQYIKHQSMVVFPCVWNHSFIFLFVCFTKEVFEVNVFSVKYASFAFRKDHFRVLSKKIIQWREEEGMISMKRCDFPLKTFFFLSQWDLFCSLMNKTFLIIRK